MFNLGLRASETSIRKVEPLVQKVLAEVDIQTMDNDDRDSPSEQAPDPRNRKPVVFCIPAEWRLALSFTADVYLCKEELPDLPTLCSRQQPQHTYSGRSSHP